MADIFRKNNFKPNFPAPPPIGHHCRPNINININNEDNGSSDSTISPLIIDLINRINKVESKVEDWDDTIISGANIELGENIGQAYPGEKGAKNALDIKVLSENLIHKADKSDIDNISQQLDMKANKDEIPEAEIYYVNDFPINPSISGLYIKGNISKFWNGSKWSNISLNTVLNLSNEASDEEVPTAKAVYNELSKKIDKDDLDEEMDRYATDEEVEIAIETKVEQIFIENKVVTGNEEAYKNLLDNINDFNNII